MRDARRVPRYDTPQFERRPSQIRGCGISSGFATADRGCVPKNSPRGCKVCLRCNLHPDAISYFSILAAAAAAVCFWQSGKNPWWLVPGPLFCYARLWCNMLDGMVALASGKASRRGEILNDLPDRISDVLIFAGVAHSGLNAVVSGYWAAIFALFTAYVDVRPGGGGPTRVQRPNVQTLAHGHPSSRRVDFSGFDLVGQ